MKILIVYDTYFGNTQKVAEFIYRECPEGTASIIKIDVLTQQQIDAFDLLIFGSPTRGFNMTKKIKKGLKKYDFKGKRFWVFDTRVNVEEVKNKILLKLVKRFGYAGEKMQAILVKRGAIKAKEHRWYFVKDSEGPLYESVQQLVKEDMNDLCHLS